jgi:hypothetical protein
VKWTAITEEEEVDQPIEAEEAEVATMAMIITIKIIT